MDNEIQLNHLASYLPYDFPIKILNHKSDYVGIEHSVITGYYFLNERLHVTYKGGSTGKSNNEFMPILRPLSDLLKTYKGSATYLDVIEFECSGIKVTSRIDNINYEYLPYQVIRKLLEWHFDIFGLIGKGLAIDVNNSNTELKEK